MRCRQYPPALARARCAWVQHPAEAETWLCGERRKIRSRSEEEAAIWSLLSAPPLLDACDPRGGTKILILTLSALLSFRSAPRGCRTSRWSSTVSFLASPAVLTPLPLLAPIFYSCPRLPIASVSDAAPSQLAGRLKAKMYFDDLRSILPDVDVRSDRNKVLAVAIDYIKDLQGIPIPPGQRASERAGLRTDEDDEGLMFDMDDGQKLRYAPDFFAPCPQDATLKMASGQSARAHTQTQSNVACASA